MWLNQHAMQAAASAPDDLAALRAALVAEQLARREAEARASGAEAMVAHLTKEAGKQVAYRCQAWHSS